MKYLILILTCAFGLCLLPRQLCAQSTVPPYVPTIMPRAPDAAALLKFVDVPVSPYTGTADVSVPLATVRLKGLTMPVNIAYHTGGIKLEEEASATGLGWALNAGGVITRTINDKDDFSGLYFDPAMPQPAGDLSEYQPANGPPPADLALLDSSAERRNCPTCSLTANCPTCPINGDKYIFEFECNYLVNFLSGPPADYTNYFSLTGTDTYDLEPDTYSYNFLGHSGKFIIKRDRTVVLEKQDNIQIQLIGNGTSFIITDDSGNKYVFAVPQITKLASLSSNTPTAWFLSKITTQQNEVVILSYGGFGNTQLASENTYQYIAAGINAGETFEGSNSGILSSNVNLKQIDYPGGQIQFFSDSLRADILGGYKLDSIRIFSKATATWPLHNINLNG